MIVVPTQASARNVDPMGGYRCPTLSSAKYGDSENPGWVQCPMLNGEMICFGSCVEFQKVAKSEDFDSHHDKGLMLKLSANIERSVRELRTICVQHQIDVASEQIDEGSGDSRRLQALRAHLTSTLAGLRRIPG